MTPIEYIVFLLVFIIACFSAAALLVFLLTPILSVLIVLNSKYRDSRLRTPGEIHQQWCEYWEEWEKQHKK